MAQKVHVVLEDDVDGGAAAETILFGLDGVNYEIDLSEDNAEKMRDALAAWVGHARRVGGRKQSGTRSGSSAPKRDDLDEVRAWARENGYQVSDRGRVAADVLKAYDDAH